MVKVDHQYSLNADVVLFNGDCVDLLKQIPDGTAMLVVTSPPYNLGKEYEKRIPMKDYLKKQSEVINECVRILNKKGSICWQVGNYREFGEHYPLDIVLHPLFKSHGLKLRNRIIWHFKSGFNSQKRFSRRYETIMWYTKEDNYNFNLDPVRVQRAYPPKIHKTGPERGQPYGSPLGKNPGDVWIIPNVQNNHVEKTEHPCQFPVGLIEKLILSLTNKGDLVVDPFIGSGTTAVASIIHKRRCAGADKMKKYIDIASKRIIQAHQGTLKYKSSIAQPEVISQAASNCSYSSHLAHTINSS